MKQSLTLLAISCLLVALTIMACGPSSPSDTESAAEAFDPASLGLTQADSSCLHDPYQICEAGLAFALLGQPIDQVDWAPYGVVSSSEEIMTGNGFQWMVKTLAFPEGQLVLEGEFIDERFADEASLQQSPINRIRVETPQFATAEALAVGSSVEELLQVQPDSLYEVISIPEYETLAVQAPSTSSLSFLIEDLGNRLSVSAGQDLRLSKLPPDATIKAVVVM